MWWIMPRYSYFVLIVFGIFQLQLLKFNVSFFVQCPRWTFCQNVAAILKGKGVFSSSLVQKSFFKNESKNQFNSLTREKSNYILKEIHPAARIKWTNRFNPFISLLAHILYNFISKLWVIVWGADTYIPGKALLIYQWIIKKGSQSKWLWREVNS